MNFWRRPMAFPIRAPEQSVRFVIADELFLRRIKLQCAAQARRDVRKVRQRRGQMARFGVGDWRFAAPDAVQKIAVMRFETDRAAHLLDEFVARTVELPA